MRKHFDELAFDFVVTTWSGNPHVGRSLRSSILDHLLNSFQGKSGIRWLRHLAKVAGKVEGVQDLAPAELGFIEGPVLRVALQCRATLSFGV